LPRLQRLVMTAREQARARAQGILRRPDRRQ